MKAYQLKISLIGSNPLIWRRVIIPADVTFKRLHDTIQFSMDWWDYHLYEFEFPFERLRITNDEEAYEDYKYYAQMYKNEKLTKENDPHGFIAKIIEVVIRQAQTTKIDKLIEKHKLIKYVYDFGDYWEHEIELEKIIEDYKYGYPTILDGEGACPPEDCGGIGGYENFLEAWNDKTHKDHESMREWGESQHYKEFNIGIKNRMLKDCLKLKKVIKP